MLNNQDAALNSLLDKLSGVRSTLDSDERQMLDLIITTYDPERSRSEVESHALIAQESAFQLEERFALEEQRYIVVARR